MDWISSFHAAFGCQVNVVRLEIYNGPIFFLLKMGSGYRDGQGYIIYERSMITKETLLKFLNLIKS